MNKWINIIALFNNYSNLKFLLKYLGTFLPDCALFPIQKLISFSFFTFAPEDQVKPSAWSKNLISAINSLFFISFRYVAVYSIISIILLSGLLLRMTSVYPEPIGLINYLAFFISFSLGVLILYSLEFLVSCLVYLYKNFSVGGWLCSELTKYSRRPDSIYSGVLRKLLFSFFPMAMISSLPALMLIFGPNYYMLLTQLFITTLALLLTVFVWNRGLIRYDSASS